MATVSIENRSNWGELIKGVGVQFLDVFNQSMNSYSLAMTDMVAQPGNSRTSVAKQLTTDKATEHFIQKTGTNYLTQTPEGSSFAQDSRILGYKTSVSPQLFSSSVSVTYQAIEDRDYNDKLNEFADLATSAKETMDKSFFDMFNYAFTAQASLPNWITGYGDGKPLASTIHPRKDGGTAQSNASATGLTLTDDNLDTARQALMRQLDDRGKPIRGGSSKLVLMVPVELEKTAVILTKSEKRSGTNNNDVNIYDGAIATVIASKWLAYTGNGGSLATTAWFLMDPVLAKLIFLLRQGVKTHKYTDPNTLVSTFYITARWANCWSDWRGFWSSKGDGAAYSS